MTNLHALETDHPCVIRYGSLAGLTGVIIGWEGLQIAIRLDDFPGVSVLISPEAVFKPG